MRCTKIVLLAVSIFSVITFIVYVSQGSFIIPTVVSSTLDSPMQTSKQVPSLRHYHSWGGEGVSIHQVLRYINYTYTSTANWTKIERKYRPFPAYITVERGNPSLWVPSHFNYVTGALLRFSSMLPYFQRALTTQLQQQQHLFPYLARVLNSVGSLPLIFDLGDHRGCPDPAGNNPESLAKGSLNVPLFTLSRMKNCQYAFPIPTYSTYKYMEFGRKNGTYIWQDQMNQWEQQYQWPAKIAKVYWRGGCKHQREQFIRLAGDYPSLFDVRAVGRRCSNKVVLPNNLFQRKTNSIEDSMRFKAVFDIDGNSWSERFPRLLCYNSAVIVIQVERDMEEYFMSDLQDGIHYIKANLSNFAEIARTALQEDTALKQIVKNANSWCQKHMTEEQLNLDFLSVLDGYVEALYSGNPEWTEIWRQFSIDHYLEKTSRLRKFTGIDKGKRFVIMFPS